MNFKNYLGIFYKSFKIGWTGDSTLCPCTSCSHLFTSYPESVCPNVPFEVCVDVCEGHTAYLSGGCAPDTTEREAVLSGDTCLTISAGCSGDRFYLVLWDSEGGAGGDTAIVDILPAPDFEIITDGSSCYDTVFNVWLESPVDSVFWVWEGDTFFSDTITIIVDTTDMVLDVWGFDANGCFSHKRRTFNPGRPMYFDTLYTICCGDSLWLCAGSAGTDSIIWYVTGDTLLPTDTVWIDTTEMERTDTGWCFLLTPDTYEPVAVNGKLAVAAARYYEDECVYYSTAQITINCPEFELTGNTNVCAGDSTILCIEPDYYTYHWLETDVWDSCLTVGPVFEDTTVCVEVWDTTEVDTLPIDIVFYVDRSGSMCPHFSEITEVVCGAFAESLSASGFDYALGTAGISQGELPKDPTDADPLIPGNDLFTDIDDFCTIFSGWFPEHCHWGDEHPFHPIL